MNAGLVPELIALRAVTDPDAIAVVAETGTLTYGELVARATPLAHALCQSGAGREQIVGLAGPRDVDSLVALVAILLSGAAYLYLDPAWPAERLRHAVTECRVRVVVGADAAAIAALGVDTPMTALASGPAPLGGSLGVSRPEDLCYVVYTSGSTGVPKGVAVEHRGVANMARQLAALFRVTPTSRMLQFAAWSWDAAVCEILVALTAGAALVLTPDRLRHGGEGLTSYLRRQHVTVATLTPSLLSALPQHALPELRTVVAVGEPCPPDVVARWGTGRRLLNGYGPTEATVAVTVGRCRPGRPVTIGRPLPGVAVRVEPLGREQSPEQGELLVGGVGLARGYVSAEAEPNPYGGPGITPADRFVADADGTRWYRTGDIVRQRGDGVLRYLGRVDDQVQVHGHRVEPGEVTAALQRHPGVRAATVIVSGGRLVAYVLTADPALRSTHIREAAARWLPQYLLPEIHLVDHLPLTEHGKLDLAALPALASSPPALSIPVPPSPAVPSARAAVAVSVVDSASAVSASVVDSASMVSASVVDEVVEQVLERLRLVLETSDVGPDDDFFDLGGHSLLAAQLAVDLAARFELPITAAQVSRHRTAAQLAVLIGQPALAAQA